MKNKKQLVYRNISCDSEQEVFILMWLFEFKDRGLLWNIERSNSFILSEPLVEKQYILLKTKIKERDKTILHRHIYTPEFRIKYYNFTGMERRVHTEQASLMAKTNNALDKLFRGTDIIQGQIDDIGSYAYFEVKPEWDQNNMTRLFKINQKWMWDKHKIFVNLVKPTELFQKTFIPKECWDDFFYKVRTKKNKVGDKKYNWEYRTFEEWITTL